MAASGFVRRFPYMPPDETIRAIEGVVIVDNAPPGTIEGVGTGCVCAVGEFTDCSYAIQADALGVITSSPRPVEVFGGQDLIDKVGGWDETLGKFGAECGNGFAALRNKTFVRLVVVPVDVVTPGSGSCYGTRYWRELPTNISATNANPIVPVAAAAIEAGREFRSGANRVRVAMRVVFSNAPAYLSALDGAVTNAAAAATQTFDAASGDFVVNGVKVGDLLVVGSLNAPSGANLTNAGTYRITAITDADTLVVEKLDGTNFAWTTGTALAWRIHPAAAGDSAGSVGTASVALSGVAGGGVERADHQKVAHHHPVDHEVAAGGVERLGGSGGGVRHGAVQGREVRGGVAEHHAHRHADTVRARPELPARLDGGGGHRHDGIRVGRADVRGELAPVPGAVAGARARGHHVHRHHHEAHERLVAQGGEAVAALGAELPQRLVPATHLVDEVLPAEHLHRPRGAGDDAQRVRLDGVGAVRELPDRAHAPRADTFDGPGRGVVHDHHAFDGADRFVGGHVREAANEPGGGHGWLLCRCWWVAVRYASPAPAARRPLRPP
jgi:hypothetical protein